MSPPNKERLLTEIGDIIRNMPPPATIRQDTPENNAWFGRASAAIVSWDFTKTVQMASIHEAICAGTEYAAPGLQRFTTLLHQARHALLLQLPGTGTVAIPQGRIFDYFDEIRRIIELAKQNILFVDPYLDVEFVSRYLPYVSVGVSIRLLTRYKLATLLPAADMFAQQNATTVEVRSASNLHDRYVIIDGITGYQSGASFKDGAKSAPTTVTEIVDAFAAVKETYDAMWQGAQVHRE